MIGWYIGLGIFVLGLVMFIVSLISNTIKKDYTNPNYLIWCIVLNVGNIIVQFSRFWIK
jgi:hypothetical protein